jgi:hypothetical protein
VAQPLNLPTPPHGRCPALAVLYKGGNDAADSLLGRDYLLARLHVDIALMRYLAQSFYIKSLAIGNGIPTPSALRAGSSQCALRVGHL